MADIRIRQLPNGGGPVAGDFLAIDNGTTRRATIQDAVTVGRPTASQVEAETGTEPFKAMTPLTTRQAVDSYGLTKSGNLAGLASVSASRANLGLGTAAVANSTDFATSAQGATADNAIPKVFLAPADNTNIQSQLTTYSSVDLLSNTTYTRTTALTLTDGRNIEGREANFEADTGIDSLFKLDGFNANVKDVYVLDNRDASGPAIVINDGRFNGISGVKIVNSGTYGIRYAAGFSSVHKLDKIIIEGCSGTAIEVQSGVSKIQGQSFDVFGLLVAGPGGLRPTPGSIGYWQNTPDHTNAVGGHQITNSDCESFATGWRFTDAQLSIISNVHGDSCSGYALLVDGNTSDMEFNGFFAGTSMGVKFAGTSSNNIVRNLTTRFTGVIPPWGSTDFYDAAGPYYDVTVADTANVIIDGDSWRGDKKISVASGAKLTITGGFWLNGKSKADVVAGVTGYLGPDAFDANESNAIWRAPRDGLLVVGHVLSVNAPGAGQSYTYTLRKNGVDTAITFTSSGASAFGGEVYAVVQVSKFDSISLKLVTSAGAATSRHWFNAQLLGP